MDRCPWVLCWGHPYAHGVEGARRREPGTNLASGASMSAMRKGGGCVGQGRTTGMRASMPVVRACECAVRLSVRASLRECVRECPGSEEGGGRMGGVCVWNGDLAVEIVPSINPGGEGARHGTCH